MQEPTTASERRQETSSWIVSTRDPNDPDAKWVPKPDPDGQPFDGWRTPPHQASPANVDPVVVRWIQDMNEWGQMMHEAVLELRERVRRLEGPR
jgi:hypothetical protein